jgi:hypothetical protein
MQRLAQEGKLLCRTPFGWYQDPATRKFIPIDEQQQVIEQLQLWYMCGVKPSEMAHRLNESGFAPLLNLHKKTPTANPSFTNASVWWMLRGNHIHMDDKTPEFSYEQRVENWNASVHKIKDSNKRYVKQD